MIKWLNKELPSHDPYPSFSLGIEPNRLTKLGQRTGIEPVFIFNICLRKPLRH